MCVVRARRDARRRPAVRRQEALGLELAVALLDEAARDAELPGELPRRRQPLAGREASAPDPVAKLPLELDAERLGPRPVEPHQQLRTQTGPLDRHGIGSYAYTGSLLGSPHEHTRIDCLRRRPAPRGKP